MVDDVQSSAFSISAAPTVMADRSKCIEHFMPSALKLHSFLAGIDEKEGKWVLFLAIVKLKYNRRKGSHHLLEGIQVSCAPKERVLPRGDVVLPQNTLLSFEEL